MGTLWRRLIPAAIKADVRKYVGDVAAASARRAVGVGVDLAQPDGDVGDVDLLANHQQRLAIADANVIVLSDRIADVRTQLSQLEYVLREARLAPPPPKHLQVRVVGGYVPQFMESGNNALRDLDAALAFVDRSVDDFRRILDFGCGCGRVIRTLKARNPQARLSGTDIDPEAIGWLAENYQQFGEFAVAPHLPPLPYGDNTFDFIYGISVLTHLPEDMQFRWLEELRRITQPGGYVVLSIHGEKHWKPLPESARKVVETRGFLYSDLGSNYGASINLPDFYQTAFHTHDYVRREWARYFTVLDIQTLRMDRHQDTVLLRKPA